MPKKAIRIIFGISTRTHCTPLFVQSGILTLPSIFVLDALLYVRQNMNSFSLCSNVHNYPTRCNNNIYIPKCKFSKTMNNFSHKSLNIFNSLPQNLQNLPISLFKTRIKTTLKANPLYSVDDIFNFNWV